MFVSSNVYVWMCVATKYQVYGAGTKTFATAAQGERVKEQ